MTRPTPKMVTPHQADFSWQSRILLCSVLLASLAPFSLLPVELEFFAVTIPESFTPPNDDDSDDLCDEAALFSSRLYRSPPAAFHLMMVQRSRLARNLRLLAGSWRLENLSEPILRNAPVSSRAYPLPPLSGCEHSQRNGIGTPLLC
jgi:hypothetical protein